MRKGLNVLGINAHEKSVSGCRIEFVDNIITVHNHYLWVLKQLDHISYMIEQIVIDFDIRNLCIIEHKRTEDIIEHFTNYPPIKILQVSESDFENQVELVRTIQEKIRTDAIVFTDKTSQVKEFFEEFSSSASFFNKVEKNEYETSYVWAFILACSVVLEKD